MGKKKRKGRKEEDEAEAFSSSAPSAPSDPSAPEEQDLDFMLHNQGPKSRSKICKRMQKRLEKEKARKREKDPLRFDDYDGCGYFMVSVYVKDNSGIEKDFLIGSIKTYIDGPFRPLGYFKGETTMTFFIEGEASVADSLRSLHKRIQSPIGELMGIKVSFVRETEFMLNFNQLEQVKSVISKRINRSCGLCDLSSFHLDKDFEGSNTFAPLCNKKILKQVFNYINESMPDIIALDLSNNKITTSCLALFEILYSSCRSLSALNLSGNNIKEVKFLRCLRPFPLKEIKILGNVFNRNVTELHHKLEKAVRKELPFLKVIDGYELRNTNHVDLLLAQVDQTGITSNSPIVVARLAAESNSASAVTEEKLKTFLEQYYSLVDTDQKETLLQAYIPEAQITLKSLNPLIPSRVFEGAAGQVSEFLQSWPATKHDHASFNLQVLSISPTEGIAQVEGKCLFSDSQLLLQFKRTMKIIPHNSGFCCAADLLEIA